MVVREDCTDTVPQAQGTVQMGSYGKRKTANVALGPVTIILEQRTNTFSEDPSKAQRGKLDVVVLPLNCVHENISANRAVDFTGDS